MTKNTENITPIIVKLLGNEFTLIPDRKLKLNETKIGSALWI